MAMLITCQPQQLMAISSMPFAGSIAISPQILPQLLNQASNQSKSHLYNNLRMVVQHGGASISHYHFLSLTILHQEVKQIYKSCAQKLINTVFPSLLILFLTIQLILMMITQKAMVHQPFHQMLKLMSQKSTLIVMLVVLKLLSITTRMPLVPALLRNIMLMAIFQI